MNLCQNIQNHRKKLNMSQEELGNMLYVSRQTISMWEKGSTVPTLDNLVRLSEIFSISVDELLKGEGRTRIEENTENYVFHFTSEELKEIRSYQNAVVYKRPVCFISITIILLLSLILNEVPDMWLGFASGVFLIGTISYIKGLVAYRKTWKNSIPRILESTYRYAVFEDYLEVEVLRGGNVTKTYNLQFGDIEDVWQFKNHYLLQVSGQIFLFRKSDLKETSALYSYLYNNPSKLKEGMMPNRWKVTSIVLFVLSLGSVYLALLLVSLVSEQNTLSTQNMWLFFTMLPIPIASIVFGYVAKHKGYQCKKNIIGGIIMIVLLCIYGSFSFIF